MDMIKGIHKQRLALIIAAAVGIISVFLPWATVNAGFLGRISVNAFEGWDGWAIILMLAGALSIAFVGDRNESIDFSVPRSKWGLVATGALCAIIALINLIDVVSTPSIMGVSASPGIGVFLAIIAGAGVAVIPFLNPEMFNKMGGNNSSE